MPDAKLTDEQKQEARALADRIPAQIAAWQQQALRPMVRGVCIDSTHSLDRDDAIWFDMRDEVLVVEVTIADVAGFLPADSALDSRAQQMVETEYGADTVLNPMLPFCLSQDDDTEGNGLLSLSDKTLRAGVTTRITLSRQTGQMQRVEIFPSLIAPEIVDYQTLAAQMESGGRFVKWAEYTALLKGWRKQQNEAVLPLYIDEASNPITRVNEEGSAAELPASEFTAHRMVEETALLANIAKARWFAHSGLPYLFRVHKLKLSGKGFENDRGYYRLSEAEDARQALAESRDIAGAEIHVLLERARYSHRRRHHAGLDEFAYAHSTSPLRRYPDIVNQRMEHWLAAMLKRLTQTLCDSLGDKVSEEDILRYLGQLPADYQQSGQLGNGKLLGWLGRYAASESARVKEFAHQKLRKYLLEALRVWQPRTPLVTVFRQAKQLTEEIICQITPPPYTAETMESLARRINAMQASKGQTEREKLAQHLLANQIERELELAELQVLSALEIPNHAQRNEIMAGFSAEKRFPLLLHLSAQQRQEYKIPASLILKRMQQSALKEPADLATILVQMRLPCAEDALGDTAFADAPSQAWLAQNCADWQQLKRAILIRFTRNPAFAKGFLKYLEQRYDWRVHSLHASLREGGTIAAVMSLHLGSHADSPAQIPPYFSIGHWGKTTRHHARIGLLEALSTHSLTHTDKVPLPYPLMLMEKNGAELLQDKHIMQQLEDAFASQSIRLRQRWMSHLQHYIIEAYPPTPRRDPLVFIGEGIDEKAAKIVAFQALLFNKLSKEVQAALSIARENLQEIPINAEDALQWLDAQAAALRCEWHRPVIHHTSPRREPHWQAQLTVHLGQHLHRQFTTQSTQQEVAITFACEAALRYLHERADNGDTTIGALLAEYKHVIQQSDFSPTTRFAAEVPYNATLVGNEIIPISD